MLGPASIKIAGMSKLMPHSSRAAILMVRGFTLIGIAKIRIHCALVRGTQRLQVIPIRSNVIAVAEGGGTLVADG